MFDKKRFKAAMVIKDINVAGLAKELGVNESTLYRKINNDGNFTRDEIAKLVNILDIEDVDSIFFSKETCV